jgi:starch-binding outer membrane protein, SusD/RagB family
MKNKLNYWILFTAITFAISLFSSCEKDFLDTTPVTAISEEEAYSTPAKILAQVNNLYGQLQSATLYGGRLIVFNEQRAEEFGQNDGNAATGSAIWNQNVASTSEYINNVWSAAYTAINASNKLINNLEQSNVISDSLAAHYIAEAKFVRALSYLCLLHTYAKPYNMDREAPGVPLRLEPITTSGYNDLARSSVEEVYNQIIQDLDEAEEALPTAYPNALQNISRASKSTAIALKTRVYLHQNDYNNVMTEAAKIAVGQSAPFQYSAGARFLELESDIAAVYSGDYTGSESIFTIPFANSTTETPPSQSALAFNYVKQPILFLTTAGAASLPALNDAADARAGLIGTNAANQKILRKFTKTTAPFSDYVPVIRYAEVLLNYAEAAAHNGQLDLSLELLKAVRHRANPSYNFPDSEVNTPDALLTSILTERRIELLGEGFRLGDLQRQVLALPAKVGAIGTAPEVLPDASNYIWPIPSGEISTNRLMEPN